MKNYLDPNASEVESIEKYLIDFMWNNYMKNSHETYAVANYLSGSGIMVEVPIRIPELIRKLWKQPDSLICTAQKKAYPDLIDYRESAEWYLGKSYGNIQ